MPIRLHVHYFVSNYLFRIFSIVVVVVNFVVRHLFSTVIPSDRGRKLRENEHPGLSMYGALLLFMGDNKIILKKKKILRNF